MADDGNGTRVKRWSAKRQTEVVLRLLRGEELEGVSREIQVPAHEIEDWRRDFLKSGSRGLKRAGRDPTERELVRTRAKVGELTMKLELAEIRRPRPGTPARLGPAVDGEPVHRRAQVARHSIQSDLRRGARGQRGDGAVAPYAQGGMPLPVRL